MIDLYTFQAPNGRRVTILLEELGLPYRLHSVDLRGGEHLQPEFKRINPAGAIPVIIDHDAPGGPLTLSQSAAIAIYLAEKTGRLLPADAAGRAEVLQWLLFTMSDVAAAAVGIFLTSTRLGPTPPATAVELFQRRLGDFLAVADHHLNNRATLARELSIADFSLYPILTLPVAQGVMASFGSYPNLRRWMAAMAERPSVARGMAL